MLWYIKDNLTRTNGTHVVIIVHTKGLFTLHCTDSFRRFLKELVHICGSRGRTGGQDLPPPLKNHKNKGFFSNTGPDPLKNHKASIQCWAIIGSPAKRHLNGVSLAGRCWPIYSDIWIINPLINQKQKKNLSNLDPL